MDVGVCYPWAGREADADFEEGFADAVGVGGRIFINRLLVHRFPEWSGFYSGCIECHAQCLHVVVGLAVGGGGFYGVGDSRRTADGSGNDFLIGILLAFDAEVGGEGSRTEPEVGVELR